MWSVESSHHRVFDFDDVGGNLLLRPRSHAPARALAGWHAVSEISSDTRTPEAHLQAIAASSDREAFAALFDHFAPRLRSYLLRRRRGAAEADELVQETMLTVWRKAAQFDPGRGDASAWIFAIARNLHVDAWRRRLNPAAARARAVAAFEPPAQHEAAARAEAGRRLRAALHDLPLEQREVLQSAFFEDQSHSEIAESLGLPLGTVKSRLRLALQRLRIEFEPVQ